MSERSALLRAGAAAAVAGGPRLPSGPPDSSNDSNNNPQQQYNGICGCCKWFLSGKLCTKKKLVFTGWIICGLMSFIFYFIYLRQEEEGEEINLGYILCCCLAIIMSIYATFNFRDVIRLREAVNTLVNSTKELAAQRDKIRNEVGRLKTAHNKLEGIENNLAESNKALRDNFGKFKDWSNVIDTQIKDNSENATVIRKDFKSAITQYQKLLIQNEKAILDKAYRQIENRDGQRGLSKDEFHDLIQSLPARYKLRFEDLGKTFEDFAGDDNNIDQQEFAQFMNAMAEQEANCGIELPQYGITSNVRQRQYKGDDDDDKDDEKGY